MLTGHPIVDEIGKINFEGTVIPHNWFNAIKFNSGKPDVVAIVLLSEIVYWYRPTIVKDEMTGRIKEVRKRFKADLLQRSYESFAEQFGFTKRQVKDALKRLEDAGLIVREFRDIYASGRVFANTLFIRLNPQKVLEITFGQGGMTLERQGCDVETSGVLRSNVRGVTLERQANTKTTTENTTEITTNSLVVEELENENDVDISELLETTDEEKQNGLKLKQVSQFYQDLFGPPSPYATDGMIKWVDKLSPELVIEALKITYKEGKKWGYTEGILNNWLKDGITSLNDLENKEKKKPAPRRRRQADVWDAFNNYINSLGDEEDE
ncbi:DNA replication initiation protein [Geobacillus phage vB_GthS_PT9.1]|nr:DNA replication initiation protein [Geobacillus phage vB_GthS_PT9.1]